MNDTRSKIQRQLELTFPAAPPGEAGEPAWGGIEPFAAASEPEHPVKHEEPRQAPSCVNYAGFEPPWYGPVCPVVWEGGGRKAPPYPDRRR